MGGKVKTYYKKNMRNGYKEVWVDEWFCIGNANRASPCMCCFNLEFLCTSLIILEVIAVGKILCNFKFQQLIVENIGVVF